MIESAPPAPGSNPDPLHLRHVLVIVLAGAALGVGFNALQLSANPSRALPWVKRERRVVSLEVSPQAPPASAAVAATPVAPPPHATGLIASPPPAAVAPAAAAPAAPRPTAAARAALSPPAVEAAGAPAFAVELPVIPDSRDPIEVGLDVAQEFHTAGAALFLDARSAEEYAEGHIAGAVSLPFDEVFKNPGLAKNVEANGRVLITYCGGGDCDLSRNLAFSLIDSGFRKVMVFTGGLPAWVAARRSVHVGAQP